MGLQVCLSFRAVVAHKKSRWLMQKKSSSLSTSSISMARVKSMPSILETCSVPMYQTIKKEKGKGGYEDFVECMKLYDKQEDGTMMFAELEYILTALGEPMEKEQVKIALAELAPEEDEDGLIPYDVFLKKLCSK